MSNSIDSLQISFLWSARFPNQAYGESSTQKKAFACLAIANPEQAQIELEWSLKVDIRQRSIRKANLKLVGLSQFGQVYKTYARLREVGNRLHKLC